MGAKWAEQSGGRASQAEFGAVAKCAALNEEVEPPVELWDAGRLADYLGTSKHFVYRLTREQRIGFVKVGKELRFTPADVAVWLQAESVGPRIAAEPHKQAVRTATPDTPRPRRGRPRDRDRMAS